MAGPQSISNLALLNDAALFEVARSTVPAEQHTEMTELLERKGRGEISEPEQARLDELVHAHEAVALRRAQAAVLLQRRGYDMSNPDMLDRLP